jgi:hypothetical protein
VRPVRRANTESSLPGTEVLARGLPMPGRAAGDQGQLFAEEPPEADEEDAGGDPNGEADAEETT